MIHRLARFKVKSTKVSEALKAIEDFVTQVNANERGCKMYRSLQETEDESEFTHYMIFETKDDEELHRNTEWVKEFVNKLYPLLERETKFTSMRVIGTG